MPGLVLGKFGLGLGLEMGLGLGVPGLVWWRLGDPGVG